MRPRLTVGADVRNNASHKVSGTLEGRVESAHFSQEVDLEPGETRRIVFSPEAHPELVFKNPRLWWTHDMGKPSLYLLSLTFKIKIDPKAAEEMKKMEAPEEKPGDEEKKKVSRIGRGDAAICRGWSVLPFFSDIRIVAFRHPGDLGYPRCPKDGAPSFSTGRNSSSGAPAGRTIYSSTTGAGKLRPKWPMPGTWNLNALRLEGFWGSNDDLYNLCDENGILILAGWSLPVGMGKPAGQAHRPESWRDYDAGRDQAGIPFLAGPDPLAPQSPQHPWLVRDQRSPSLARTRKKNTGKSLKEDDPIRPVLASAKSRTSTISGPTGVKMNGPYDWVSALLLVHRYHPRRGLRLQHGIRSGSPGSSRGKPEKDDSRKRPLAHRPPLELPLSPGKIRQSRPLQRSHDPEARRS